MRRDIWKKDDYFPFVSGQRIDMDPAVVTIPIGRLPLFWNFDTTSGAALGWVDGVRLEGGVISGVLTYAEDGREKQIEELFEHDDIRLGGYYTQVVKDEGGKNVIGCTLKSVSITLNPIFPLIVPEE